MGTGGNITIAGSTATSGYYLQTTGTSVQWAASTSTFSGAAFTGGTFQGTTFSGTTITASTGFTGSAFNGGTIVGTSIGIGTTPSYPLHVNGSAASRAAPYANLAYNATTEGWYQAYEPSVATNIQIYTPGNIGCAEVDVFSDRRIKSNIKDTDPEECINIIRNLKVRDFRYIDPVEHGTDTYKGLIAQEVREVVPTAVGLHEGVVPDIFQVAFDIQGSSCLINPGEFIIKIGDVIKVIDGDVSKNLTVLGIFENRVNFDSKLFGPKVFVYGHVVQDLHTVSYDRLVPILIRSVQQLIESVKHKGNVDIL